MRNYKSFLALIVISVVYVISMYCYKPYNAMYRQSEGDAAEYYMYLPAFFIHHDLATLHTTMAAKLSHTAPGVKADSVFYDKYFIGTAVLQTPFFLSAHLLAGFLHQSQDGFSMIYMYGIELSCLTYSLLGLLIIIGILKRRFSDTVSAIVILVIGVATNVYYLVVYQAPFSHPYLFFLYSLLIYFTIRFYASFRSWYIFLIGFICGMIILTRLNEVYALLIPLLWGIRTKSDIHDRFAILGRFIPYVIISAFIILLCLVPQLIYWKVSTGHFIYYSYHGESFDFLHPHFIGGLFGCNNGWLVYSPIMLLSLAGIWAVIRYKDASFVPIIFFLPVHIYVIYSWWCWFYMGSYGSRPMTEAYPLLSIPLAYSVEWFQRSETKKISLAILFLFCMWLVMFQTYQSSLNIFNSELSNWHFYLATFGKTKLTYEQSVVLDTKEFQPRNPQFVKMLGQNNFDHPGIAGTGISRDTSGHRSVCVHLGEELMGYRSTLSDAGAQAGQWIKASINCMAEIPTNHNWHLASLVVAFTRKGKMTKWTTVSLQNKIDNPEHVIWHFTVNKWGRVYLYSQLPSDMTASDTISVYIENIHQGPAIYVDHLEVDLYQNK